MNVAKSLAMIAGSIVLGVAAQTSSAQSVTSGGYIGAGVGQSDFKFAGVTNTSYEIHGGYRLNKWFALEGSYAKLGEPSEHEIYYLVCSNGRLCPVDVVTSGELKRFDIAALGIWPVTESFDLFAKLGYTYVDYTIRAHASANGNSGSASDNGHDNRPLFGVGARYNFASPWSVRTQYERLDMGHDQNVDTFWLSGEYRF